MHRLIIASIMQAWLRLCFSILIWFYFEKVIIVRRFFLWSIISGTVEEALVVLLELFAVLNGVEILSVVVFLPLLFEFQLVLI